MHALRKQVKDTKKLGEIILELDGLPISEVIPRVIKSLEKYPEDAFIQMESYGYDGAEDICVYEKIYRFETYSEVINRLKILEKSKRNKIKALDEAKELLKIKEKNMIKVTRKGFTLIELIFIIVIIGILSSIVVGNIRGTWNGLSGQDKIEYIKTDKYGNSIEK